MDLDKMKDNKTKPEIKIISYYVPPKVRLKHRLKRVVRKKAMLSKQMREAEEMYFRDRTITRETYNTLIKDYELQMVKLDNAERALNNMIKRKAKSKIA